MVCRHTDDDVVCRSLLFHTQSYSSVKTDDLLFIVEKIDREIRDRDTTDSKYRPLWQHPFLLDTFKDFLEVRTCVRLGHMSQDDLVERRKNFETVCRLLCPEFASIADSIQE